MPKRRLQGTVEVDEAFVGGAPKFRRGVKNKRGKGTSKPQVLVAVEWDGEVRATLIPDTKRTTIEPVVQRWIDPSAVLMTDAAKVYRSIGKKFAAHQGGKRYIVWHGIAATTMRAPRRARAAFKLNS